MNKDKIKNFWQNLQKEAHKKNLDKIDHTNIHKFLKNLEKLFINRNHLAINEMDYKNIHNKKVLEIGCGTGGHSLLFASKGAELTSTDITPERVDSSKKLINLLKDHNTKFKICDAENLPFDNNEFDIVYSNGVLHHTHNISKAIDEVRRVLKPGGEAIIMLYSRNSFLYYINIWFIKGIILGYKKKFKDNWIGASTEWMSDKKQKVYNPVTYVFNKNEINTLFEEFNIVSIRKNSFIFNHVPFIGKYLSKLLGMYYGYNEAGILIYDKPWRNETKLEKYLGQYIGFCYNIKVSK